MEKDLFSNYIIKVLGRTKGTSIDYLAGLRKVTLFMKHLGYEYDSIYDIDSYEELLQLKNSLMNDKEFTRLNLKHHRVYSSGLNRYIAFTEGKLLNDRDELLSLQDKPCPIKTKIFKSEIESEGRDRIIVKQIINVSNYECEINTTHKSFISKKTHHEYMEAHHLIPLNMQKEISTSLDVYSNLICLCPNCHKLLHFGVKEDKSKIIENLYDLRKYRMQDAGLRFGKKEFDELLEESKVY
jgi:5-methylcytosine-specific restriction protein A